MLKKILLWGLLALAAAVAGLVLLVALFPVPEPNDFAVAESSDIYYADGVTPIARVGDVTRTSIPLSEVPLHTQQAVLAAEDRNFYEHGGFSPVGIARAFLNNITSDSTQGGSTITQQYVKNAFLTQDQTLWRKAQELILSVKLERVMSKEQILEGYLNTIYWGRGAYGIEAASQAYFGIPAAELDVAQSAALAGIIASPNRYDPEQNPEGVQARFDYVVDGMVAEGWLSPEEAAGLVLPEFLPRETNNRLGGQTGYLVEQARKELEALGFDEAQINGGGLRVITTIDQQAQASVVRAVDRAGPKSGTDGLRIGIASVEPQTGFILAMYGGPDYVTNQLNNATQARAQGGSTFKPYALAAAFENGINLDSVWNGNSPRTISGYTLENEGNRSYGRVTLLRSTEQSINTPFVDLTDTIGVSRVIAAAERAGLPPQTPGIEENLTFVLGTASPTPLEMASTYATFATRGVYHAPTMIREVQTSGEGVLYQAVTGGEERFAPVIMDNVNLALTSVVRNGTAARAQSLGRPSAGKTGTTDDNKSAWYVGYTPQMVAAVMMVKEDEDGNPVSLSGTGGLRQVFGSSFPLSMWLSYAQGYLDGKPVERFAEPAEIPSGVNNPDPPPAPAPDPEPEPEPEPTAPQPSPEPTATEAAPGDG
jgi:membrane peptidoglycan carboxypeptidase